MAKATPLVGEWVNPDNARFFTFLAARRNAMVVEKNPEARMASCNNCGNRGFFLSVDNNGLCSSCSQIFLPQIVNDCRIVVESSKIIENSKNGKTIISRCDVGLAALSRLRPFDRKGIPTLTEPLAEIEAGIRSFRSETVQKLVGEQVFLARAKQESASTPAGKLGGYGKAIDNLNKMLLEFDDVSDVEPAIAELVRERDKVRIEIALLKTEKLLAKGKSKLAKEALIDLLVEIKHDTTPVSEQADEIAAIESRIREIGSN